MTDKRIVYNPAGGGQAVLLIPAPDARGCTLSADGEKLFAAFPNDAAVLRALIAGTPASMVNQLANPFPGLSTKLYRAETDDEFVNRIATKDVPADRTFRNAWIVADGAIAYAMPAAREIWRGVIREARDPLLAAADVDYMRALEAAQDTKAIVARKQALRDAPADPAIEAATTIEQLRAVWPAALGARA